MQLQYVCVCKTEIEYQVIRLELVLHCRQASLHYIRELFLF